MWKQILTFCTCVIIGMATAHAQDSTSNYKEEKPEPEINLHRQKYNKPGPLPYGERKYFAGGGINLGFGSGGSNFGISPIVGYSPNKYWDLGVGLGYNYSSVSSGYSYTGLKESNSTFGLGPFVRFYPIDFLFVQGQFEQNWTTLKYGGNKYKYDVSSLLGSIGYANRMSDVGTYFFSIGMDFLNDIHSPYRDYDYTDGNGKVHTNPVPIIRAGVSFYVW